MQFDIFIVIATFHQTTIGNANLKVFDWVEKIIDLLSFAPINKVMSDTTINEHHHFVISNVALNF